MKKQAILTILILCFITLGPLAGGHGLYADDPSRSEASADAPKAVVTEKVYTFDQVLEGDVVTHAYTIANQGAAPLKIMNVRTSCGCTTARKPSQIAPGAKDQIVVKANTAGRGGRRFAKTIKVSTNDPHQPTIQLKIQGQVARFVRIEPRSVNLNGRTDEALQAEATIFPEPEYPFRIIKTIPDEHLAGKIDVHMDQHDGIYHIIIRNLMTTPGNYWGKIVFETDSALRPELTLYVRARISGKRS